MEKLKEKPPVLSGKEADEMIIQKYPTGGRGQYLTGWYDLHREIQRDADMIWFQDWLKKNNYVQLDPDQNLPEQRRFIDLPQYHNKLSSPYIQGQTDAQQDMLNDKFRRVL